jgi:hypothetical protein
MKKTFVSVVYFAMLFALCLKVEAQQSPKIPRVGFLSAQSESRSADRAEAFRKGLRDLGCSGKNILIEVQMGQRHK